MQTAAGVEVRNWEGSVISHPKVVVSPRNVDDIVAILKDPERYPSPVRAIGSNHSTTRCGIADGGTIMNMRNMDRIVEIGPDFVTTEAGALYIDVAKQLERHNLQFYVNVELGNLTLGSAACGGTKDASMPGEFGQVCSYATGMKIVTPSGELLEVTEDDPELLQIMRSSYGLLGVIYEVTFRVQPLRRMSVSHATYDVDEFERQLPSLIAKEESMMLYIYAFLNKITVESRKYLDDGDAGRSPNRYSWRLRNWVWKTLAPTYGHRVTTLVPSRSVQYHMINGFNRGIQIALKAVVNSRYTVPTDQMIRYPEVSGDSKYTFSIWAFPEEDYVRVLRGYYVFCRRYYEEQGYRCDLLNVGYRISKDTSALFSYSYDGDVMTIDPVSTAKPGWEEFLQAYNQYCSDNGGVPLFNQTKWITPPQAKKAFGERLETFKSYQKQYDPENRMLNEYFREILN
jgi:FAD/FMN-containing dehydrogenase